MRHDDWRWVLEHPSVFDDDGRMTFVRGRTPQEVFEAYGVPLESVREMTLLESWGQDTSMLAPTPCVRVAVSGDWAIVMEPIRAGSIPRGPMGRVVAGHDFVMVECNEMGPNHASCRAPDGSTVGYLLGQSYDSLGVPGPGREWFEGLLHGAGLLPVPSGYSPLEEVVIVLRTLAPEFGFTLTAETVQGPLPTASLPE